MGRGWCSEVCVLGNTVMPWAEGRGQGAFISREACSWGIGPCHLVHKDPHGAICMHSEGVGSVSTYGTTGEAPICVHGAARKLPVHAVQCLWLTLVQSLLVWLVWAPSYLNLGWPWSAVTPRSFFAKLQPSQSCLSPYWCMWLLNLECRTLCLSLLIFIRLIFGQFFQFIKAILYPWDA